MLKRLHEIWNRTTVCWREAESIIECMTVNLKHDTWILIDGSNDATRHMSNVQGRGYTVVQICLKEFKFQLIDLFAILLITQLTIYSAYTVRWHTFKSFQNVGSYIDLHVKFELSFDALVMEIGIKEAEKSHLEKNIFFDKHTSESFITCFLLEASLTFLFSLSLSGWWSGHLYAIIATRK